MKSKPEIADEEIRSLMDFDQLIRNHENLVIRRNKFKLMNKILAVSLIVISVPVIWYTFMLDRTNKAIESQSVPGHEPSVQLDSRPDSSQLKKQPDEIKNLPPTESMREARPSDDADKKETRTPKEDIRSGGIERKEPDRKTEYSFVEAEPVDGYPNLYDYFNRELKYPSEGLVDSIQGIVTVSFLINTKGKPEKIEIKNSLGEVFDREVKKVIENMPLWRPASVNGNPVSSRLSVPLTFQIKKTKSPKK
ncbi:MAG TPA: TonB family protein [Cyclobacteriaceae bacterium]|nr:TonB family protein [Cyclobacteriaceae bacterium]